MSTHDLSAVLTAIERSRRVLVASHVDPEGDSLGSQLGSA